MANRGSANWAMRASGKSLFFPAMTLLRWNASIQSWREALRQRGKTKRQVVGTVTHRCRELMRYGSA